VSSPSPYALIPHDAAQSLSEGKEEDHDYHNFTITTKRAKEQRNRLQQARRQLDFASTSFSVTDRETNKLVNGLSHVVLQDSSTATRTLKKKHPFTSSSSVLSYT
jgi:hypothetical protein